MKTLLTSLLFALTLTAFAQDRSIRFSAYPHSTFTDQRTTIGAGISFEVPIGERFGIFYNHSVGARIDGGIYAHTGATTLAGVWLLSNIDDDGFLNALGAFLLFVPEGVSYDLVRNDDIALTAYVSVNSFDYIKVNGVEDNRIGFGSALGYTRSIGDKIFVGFEVGSRRGYVKPGWIADAKIRIGWNLAND